MCAYTHQKAAVGGAGTSMPHRRRASMPTTQHERRAKMRLVDRQPNLYPQTPLLAAGGTPVQLTQTTGSAVFSRGLVSRDTGMGRTSTLCWPRKLYGYACPQLSLRATLQPMSSWHRHTASAPVLSAQGRLRYQFDSQPIGIDILINESAPTTTPRAFQLRTG